MVLQSSKLRSDSFLSSFPAALSSSSPLLASSSPCSLEAKQKSRRDAAREQASSREGNGSGAKGGRWSGVVGVLLVFWSPGIAMVVLLGEHSRMPFEMEWTSWTFTFYLLSLFKWELRVLWQNLSRDVSLVGIISVTAAKINNCVLRRVQALLAAFYAVSRMLLLVVKRSIFGIFLNFFSSSFTFFSLDSPDSLLRIFLSSPLFFSGSCWWKLSSDFLFSWIFNVCWNKRVAGLAEAYRRCFEHWSNLCFFPSA